jgi:c-di-GMP-binding flagellar brake protein YcgR
MDWDKIDRRRFVRIKFPFTIHVYTAGEPPITAYTEDISEGGAKVTIHQNIALSSLVNLEIYLKLRPINCQGKVIWVNKRESEYLVGELFYDIGMEFQGLNPYDKEAIQERLGKVAQERKASEEADL